MKKLFSSILVGSLVLGSLSFNSFTSNAQMNDISSHWAKNYIESLIDKKAIAGYEDGSFKPDQSVSNAEFTKILITALGYADINNASAGHWAAGYIDKAVEVGILKEGEFKQLDENITRAQMAAMIARSIKEDILSKEELGKWEGQIKDYSNIPSLYKDYVLTAYTKGIITGYQDGTFKSEKTATRAEASTMIIRMLEKDKRKVPTFKKEYKDAEEFGNRSITDFISEGIPKVNSEIDTIPLDKIYISSYSDLPLKIGKVIVYKIEKFKGDQEYLKITTNSESGSAINITYIKSNNKKGVVVTSVNYKDKNKDGTYSYYYECVDFFNRNKIDANAYNSEYIVLSNFSSGVAVLIDNPFKK